MKNFLKYFLILAVILACILSYHFFKAYEEKRIIEKEIVYSSDVAAEVDMVWGINYSQLPSKDLWPQGSYAKNGLVYTKMKIINGDFKTKISLPNKTILNYWVVQRKDKNGNSREIWDAGRAGKDSYFVTFTDESFFSPGYFIFLAGFLPLLILYYTNSKTTPNAIYDKLYKLKTYIPQLDSIRAIAVLLVVIHHWLPKDSFLNILPNGSLGVTIFFVLSGFLITSILLKSKKQIDEQSLKTSAVFKNFYIRRTLRACWGIEKGW